MPVQTMLLDFSIDPARLGDESGQKAVFGELETVLKDYIPNLLLAADIKIDGGSLKLLTGKRGTTVSVRMFDRGLVTVNIEYYKEENEEPVISFKTGRVLENQLKKYITVINSQVYVPIKRCLFGRYYPTSDERLLEYDIDGILFDEQSPFQRVQIVHSRSLGNMLVLDDLQNISEADLIYTETLMQRGKESYTDKEIVILGGGDGALLYELLKEKPKFVWMLEIDELVMTACNKHLKSICGDVLERRKGPNYEIIVEDCMLTVNKFIQQGRKVDYVFGDLTDIPISEADCGELWEFMINILRNAFQILRPTGKFMTHVDYVFGDLTDIPISEADCGELWEFMINILRNAFQILRPTGKFMTHGNGATSPKSLELYEQELAKLKPPVAFTRTKAFVPSFLEDWVFYQISFKNADNGDA